MAKTKDEYWQEHSEEVWVSIGASEDIKCKTCRWQKGAAPWADRPDKAHCLMYPKDQGKGKPNDVYFYGKDCIYYEKE